VAALLMVAADRALLMFLGDALAQYERNWYFNKTFLKALSAGTQTGRFLFSRRWALSA
jgi:hypothetical protein